MTHAQLRKSIPPIPGLPPNECPGVLDLVGAMTDISSKPPQSIYIHACDCGSIVIENRTANRIDNDYSILTRQRRA